MNNCSGGLQGAFYNLKIRALAKRLEPSPECGKIRAESKKNGTLSGEEKVRGRCFNESEHDVRTLR